LILGLGANDGLRGLPVDEMRRNLSAMIERAQARHITVVLCGMEAPPNFGASYTASFRAAFKDLAAKHDVAFVPFLLDGVAGVADLNQEDGIHPNARGAQRVADTVWSTLRPLLLTKTASPS
jgi:acyl-CoA thioesterase-1